MKFVDLIIDTKLGLLGKNGGSKIPLIDERHSEWQIAIKIKRDARLVPTSYLISIVVMTLNAFSYRGRLP